MPKKKRTHQPHWKDGTVAKRQSKRREQLNQIAVSAGWQSWSAYETTVLNRDLADLESLQAVYEDLLDKVILSKRTSPDELFDKLFPMQAYMVQAIIEDAHRRRKVRTQMTLESKKVEQS